MPKLRGDDSTEEDPRGFEWYFLDRQIRPQSDLLFQNDEPLYLIEFMRGGNEFFTAGKDSIVRWHNTSTGNVDRRLDTRQKEINGVSYNPAGTLFATAGEDGTVKIWNVADLSLLHSINVYNGVCGWARFLDDDKILTGGFGKAHHLYNAASGQLLREYTTPNGELAAKPRSWNAHLSVAGDRFWTTENDASGKYRGVYEWNVETGEAREISKDFQLCNLLTDNSEKYLFVNTVYGQIRILDVQSGDEVRSLQLANELEAMTLSPDESSLAIGDNNGQIHLLSLALNTPEAIFTPEVAPIIRVHKGTVYEVAFAPDGKSLYSVGRDGSVQRTLPTVPAQPLRELVGLSRHWCIPIPDSKYVLVFAAAPLSIREPATGRIIRRFSSFHYQEATISSDGTLIAAASPDRLEIWNAAKGELINSLNHRRQRSWLKFSANNARLSAITSDENGRGIDIVNIRDGMSESNLVADGATWAYTCCDDGVVAYLGPQAQVVCWNAQDRTVRWKTKPFRGRYFVAGMSPDMKSLLVRDGRIVTLLDCATGDARYMVPCDYPISSLAFTADGKSFAVGGKNGELSVWHSSTGHHLFNVANLGTAIESIQPLGDGFLTSTQRVKDGRSERVWFEF
jgi:WD40 repeat protein